MTGSTCKFCNAQSAFRNLHVDPTHFDMGRKFILPSMLGKQCRKVCRTFRPAKCRFLSALEKS